MHVPHTRIRGLRPVLAGLLLALAGSVPFAAPASAHDELVSTAPASGASLTAAPTEVVLTFGEDVEPLGTAVAVTGPDKARLSRGAPVIDGGVLTQPIAAPAVSGTVTVAYRVVSADGHPVTGRYTFTVTLPAVAPTSAAPPSATPTPSSTSASAPAATLASATGVPGEAGPEPGSRLPWLVLGLVVAAVVVGAVALATRARRRTRSGGGSAS